MSRTLIPAFMSLLLLACPGCLSDASRSSMVNVNELAREYRKAHRDIDKAVVCVKVMGFIGYNYDLRTLDTVKKIFGDDLDITEVPGAANQYMGIAEVDMSRPAPLPEDSPVVQRPTGWGFFMRFGGKEQRLYRYYLSNESK